MKLVFTLKDLVKYIIFIGVVYTILNMLPSEKLCKRDMILIVLVIVGGFLLLDSYYKTEGFVNIQDDGKPDKYDTGKEGDEYDSNDGDDNDSEDYATTDQQDIDASDDLMYAEDEVSSVKSGTKSTEKTVQEGKNTNENNDNKNNRSGNNYDNGGNQANINIRGEGGFGGSGFASGKDNSAEVAEALLAALKAKEEAKSKAKEEGKEKEDSDTGDTINNYYNQEGKTNNGLTPKSETSKGELKCDIEIDNLKRKVENTISELQDKVNQLQGTSSSNENSLKYMALLMKDLLDKGILDEEDITNIDNKLDTKVITVDDMIKHLERLKLISKPKNKNQKVDSRVKNSEYDYNELPPDFYKPLGSKELSLWDNQYTILNTDKWKVPMPKPPVCVNNTPCNVCPNDDPIGYSSYPLNLKEWENARKFTNMTVNKDWANNQVDSSSKGTDIYKY